MIASAATTKNKPNPVKSLSLKSLSLYAFNKEQNGTVIGSSHDFHAGQAELVPSLRGGATTPGEDPSSISFDGPSSSDKTNPSLRLWAGHVDTFGMPLGIHYDHDGSPRSEL